MSNEFEVILFLNIYTHLNFMMAMHRNLSIEDYFMLSCNKSNSKIFY